MTRRTQTTGHRQGNAALSLLLIVLVIAGGAVYFWLRSSPSAEPRETTGSSPLVTAPDVTHREEPGIPPAMPPTPDSATGSEPPLDRSVQPTLPDDEPRYDENGDRIVIGLDGLLLRQPRDARVTFGIFREGERNELGLPSGVLPDGSWVYYNIPTTVTQNGRTVETLNRYVATPQGGEVVDPESGSGLPPGVGGK